MDEKEVLYKALEKVVVYEKDNIGRYRVKESKEIEGIFNFLSEYGHVVDVSVDTVYGVVEFVLKAKDILIDNPSDIEKLCGVVFNSVSMFVECHEDDSIMMTVGVDGLCAEVANDE